MLHGASFLSFSNCIFMLLYHSCSRDRIGVCYLVEFQADTTLIFSTPMSIFFLNSRHLTIHSHDCRRNGKFRTFRLNKRTRRTLPIMKTISTTSFAVFLIFLQRCIVLDISLLYRLSQLNEIIEVSVLSTIV